MSKLGKYSFVAGATLSVLSGCGSDEEDDLENAIIGYIDLHPDINLIPPINRVSYSFFSNGEIDFLDLVQLVDLNEDGIDDVSIRIANYDASLGRFIDSIDYVYYSYHIDKGTSEATGLNGAKILIRTEPLDTLDGFVTKSMEVGEEINGIQSIWGETGELGVDEIRKSESYFDSETNTYVYNTFETVFGDYLGNEKFIGVQFEADGQKHYGWVRINVALDGKSMKIKDYAYHKMPNTSIDAGMK
jgi:hypothetical protein